MAQTKAIVDKLLTGASQAVSPKGFIAEELLPSIKVKQNSGKLGTYGNDHLRIVTSVMGGRGKAPRIQTITRSSESYFIENHGLEGLVTKDDYDNVEEPFDAEKDEVMGLTTILKLAREKSLADVLTSTSIITQNQTLAGTAQFSDFANSDPLGKFDVARQTIYDAVGIAPDTAVMSWAVANKLAFHPAILDALGFTQNRAGQLSNDELAKAMGVERLLIGASVYNSASEGQSDSLTSVWGKHVVFGVMPKTAAKYQVSVGYNVRKSSEAPYKVYRYVPGNPPEANAFIVTDNYDDLISQAGAAYLLENAIA